MSEFGSHTFCFRVRHALHATALLGRVRSSVSWVGDFADILRNDVRCLMGVDGMCRL